MRLGTDVAMIHNSVFCMYAAVTHNNDSFYSHVDFSIEPHLHSRFL